MFPRRYYAGSMFAPRFFPESEGEAGTPLVYAPPHFVAGTVYIPGFVAASTYIPGFAAATVVEDE